MADRTVRLSRRSTWAKVGPDESIRLGRALFALGLMGLGTTHFTFQAFIAGRAPPWPAAIPGGEAWALVTGGLLVGMGLAILMGRKALLATVLAGAVVFVWALLRHIPVVAVSPFPSGAWTDAGKSLRLVGGALAVAATLPRTDSVGNPALSRLWQARSRLILLARICLAPTLILNGYQHFVFTEFVAGLIPGWFPGDATLWTWFAGVALIAGGVGLLLPAVARWAALLSGIMILSWFFIVHLTGELAGSGDGIAVFEVLVTAGTAFLVAGFLHRRTGHREDVGRTDPNRAGGDVGGAVVAGVGGGSSGASVGEAVRG